MEQTQKWVNLSVKEKIQYSLAAMFGIASIAIGFVAFILLMEIPGSVITISLCWASTCCALIGISLHFKHEMSEFQSKVNDRLMHLDNDIEKIDKAIEESS